MRWVAQHRGIVYTHFADINGAEKCFHVLVTSSEALSTSDSVAGTWKRFPASSTSVTWAWGLWGGGMVIILQVEGVCVSSQHRTWTWLPEYNRNYKKDQYCGSQTHRMLPRINHVGNTKP